MRQKKSKFQYMICHVHSKFGEAETLGLWDLAEIQQGTYLGRSIKAAMKNFTANAWDKKAKHEPKDLLVWLFQDGQPLWKIPYGPDEE